MKRSYLSFAVLALAAACTFVSDTCMRAVAAVGRLAVHVVDVLAAPAAMESDALSKPARALSAAQAFHARIVKRERPTIQGNWRMCPTC